MVPVRFKGDPVANVRARDADQPTTRRTRERGERGPERGEDLSVGGHRVVPRELGKLVEHGEHDGRARDVDGVGGHDPDLDAGGEAHAVARRFAVDQGANLRERREASYVAENLLRLLAQRRDHGDEPALPGRERDLVPSVHGFEDCEPGDRLALSAAATDHRKELVGAAFGGLAAGELLEQRALGVAERGAVQGLDRGSPRGRGRAHGE